MPGLKRDAISRARFFLQQAREYPYSENLSDSEEFKSYLEAAIIFGRVAIHRVHRAAENTVKGDPRMRADVRAWWDALLEDPASRFFREERDFILKQGPPMVGQIVRLPSVFGEDSPTIIKPESPLKAEELYYYENPERPATVTAERHLASVAKTVADAEDRFGTNTLLGGW